MEMAELKRISMDNPEIRKNGRGKVVDGRFPMFFTASGIEFMLKGSELWIELSSNYYGHESWTSVLLNDARISRMMVPKGSQTFCIFRGMSGDKVKNVRIYKDVQAMSGDDMHLLQVM